MSPTMTGKVEAIAEEVVVAKVKHPENMLRPLNAFTSQDEYVRRHEQGTLIEMSNEVEVLKRFNERQLKFKAWAIAPIPGLTTSFAKSWVVLVKVPPPSDDIIFPSINDKFTVDVIKTIKHQGGKYSLVNLVSTRIQNPYEDSEDQVGPLAAKCAAFKVDVPRSWENEQGINVELDLMGSIRTAKALNDFESFPLDDTHREEITIRWDTYCLTYEAELAALRFFVEEHRLEERTPSFKSKEAFQMTLNFKDCWVTYYDLQKAFPHLKKPEHPYNQLPKVLVERFRGFNADHRAAYDGLAQIPNGMYFVNGCPGAGKTEWNMVVSALIQCKRRPQSKRRHSPILFVVDLNKTVDDAADRYFTLCKAAGLKLRIVRMHGWPYEMKNSSKLNRGSSGGDKGSEGELDFTRKFLTTVNVGKHSETKRDLNKAPTLDEVAWEYFEKHKDDCFMNLDRILKRMDTGEALSTEDWKALRSQISMLYRAVLAQTDFIATTPVAAYGSFSKLFRPEVVFIDEAPHAREMTTLIPLAYFDPVAWIFTGDVKQTRPFVKGGDKRDMARQGLTFNPYSEQLQTSMMARAEAVDAINSKLLVNKRSFANLHLLPSRMFYKGQMISGYPEKELYPPSVSYLKKYLEEMGSLQNLTENRIVVHVQGGQEETQRGSFWNPSHHRWVMAEAHKLLSDPEFRSISDARVPGKIMVQTPYSTAVREYAAEVKQWDRDLQDRINILTVDKAQGNQADVVILDMVRTEKAGFMNEPQRLNVAITRSRQAEIIVMNPGMGWRKWRGQKIKAEFTSQIWDDAQANGRLMVVGEETAEGETC